MTAVCFARKDNQVIGIDPDKKRLEKIKQSKSLFFEPHLDEYLAEAIDLGKFEVTNDPHANTASNICYIAVGTPCDDRGHINLNYVRNAALSIGRSLKRSDHNQLVVVKSTVTPGTTRNTIRATIEHESTKISGRDFGICSNPEFLREGTAIRDTEYPDRIIIGSDDSIAMKRLESFYKEFHGEHLPPIIRTTYENAELIKYANNAFLATKISFINTIANIAERIPFADVTTIRNGIGPDSRIAPRKETFQALIEQEKDPRATIRIAFRFAESMINESIRGRRPRNETHLEFCSRVTGKYPSLKNALTRLVEIFESAEYTSKQIQNSQRAEVVNAVLELIELSKSLGLR